VHTKTAGQLNLVGLSQGNPRVTEVYLTLTKSVHNVFTQGGMTVVKRVALRRQGQADLYQRQEFGFGSPAGPAILSLDRAIPAFAPSFGRADIVPTLPARRFAFDLVVDLGAEIGTLRWWRGVATCCALLAAAWMLGPSFKPLPATQSVALSADAWAQSRAQAIAPLAWGGDTGRRMAATDAVQNLASAPERPVLELTATIGQGDGFVHALERAGVGEAEAMRIAAMTRDIVDPADIAPGTTIGLMLGRRATATVARPVQALSFRARFDMKLNFVRSGDGLMMQRVPIAIDGAPLRIQGRVGEGIFVGATAAGAPSDAVQDYLKAIAGKVELGNLDPNAQFDLIVERQRAATGEVKYGKLLYVGMTDGNRATRMIQWTIDGRSEWYDASGVGERRAGFTAPVDGHRTSSFGMRFHPLLGYNRMHQGTDYGAVYGSPIRAVTDGIVEFAGWHGGHGNMVKIAHAGGLGSGYAHMSRIAVAPGAKVAQGQVIGFVGSTGLSTGPHLHFEVYRGGVAVDPGSVNFATTSLLSGDALAAFRARFAAITAVR
jgi:murein DD-endopeptidase MepM/ murein hydrolase activator NlpD